MMKKSNRLLSLLFVTVMLLSMVVNAGFAMSAEESVYSGICGDDLTWTIDSGVLEISGTGDMYDVNYYPWKNHIEPIESVVINDGVTSIGEFSFSNVFDLKSLSISDSVTSIGRFAFYNCTALESVVIPDGITTIGDFVFNGCTNLTSIVIPDSVTTIGSYAFSKCTKLENIIIPDSVTTIGCCAFSECMSLESVEIPNGVTTMESFVFNWCKDLESITLPNSITTIKNNAFSGCLNLKTIDIPDSVTTIGDGAFMDCLKFESIFFPDSITSVGHNAFAGAHNLVISCYKESAIADYAEENDIPYCCIPVSEVITDGMKITVKKLDGVRDIFIAKGDYNTYREVNDNMIVRITPQKLAGLDEYTYVVSETGIHTIYVRYDDGVTEDKIIKVDLTVTEPVFTENGLQLAIGNLDDLKVIRTAYGEYTKSGEVKNASGARNLSAKEIYKSEFYDEETSSFKLQYREEGLVTVVVEYLNRHTVIYHYNVVKKTAIYTQDKNTVTFENLDGLKVLRYAKGEYETSSQIKAAQGNVALTAKKVVDGKITVKNLAAGTYTFCVQYDDESYNYYTIIVE